MRVAGFFGLFAACLLSGCATLPPIATNERSSAVAATADTQLGALAARIRPFEQATGFHLLVSGVEAYEARLQLIERAQASIDIQYYHFALDATGISLAEALLRAARRGVRVRFLVDDYHTAGQDDALLALSSEPGVDVRIYNPFVGARDSTALRWISSIWDFRRVVDGAMAIMGGRNIADAYFQRGEGAAFLDLDLLLVGSVLPSCNRSSICTGTPRSSTRSSRSRARTRRRTTGRWPSRRRETPPTARLRDIEAAFDRASASSSSRRR